MAKYVDWKSSRQTKCHTLSDNKIATPKRSIGKALFYTDYTNLYG